jgi:hypothetical protein
MKAAELADKQSLRHKALLMLSAADNFCRNSLVTTQLLQKNDNSQTTLTNSCTLATCWFLAWLILQPWTWTKHVPLKYQLTFNGLNGIISQKTELFSFQHCCYVFRVSLLCSKRLQTVLIFYASMVKWSKCWRRLANTAFANHTSVPLLRTSPYELQWCCQ